MDTTFKTKRSAVLTSLNESRSEIKCLNQDINHQIIYNKSRISQLKLENKKLKRSKIRGSWVIALLIRFLK